MPKKLKELNIKINELKGKQQSEGKNLSLVLTDQQKKFKAH